MKTTWTDMTRAERARLLSRTPLALACSVQGGRRWHSRNGVLVDGALSNEFSPGYLSVAVLQSRKWAMEQHDPDSPMTGLAFDVNHAGTLAHLTWVFEGGD
jgi:hypothetical protein